MKKKRSPLEKKINSTQYHLMMWSKKEDQSMAVIRMIGIQMNIPNRKISIIWLKKSLIRKN